MAQQTKHTPLDWVLRTSKSEVEIVGDYHSPDSILEMPNNSKNKANAEMICKAVNNHDKLVEALKGFIDNCAENPKIATNQIQYYKSHFKKLLQSIKD